MKTVKKFFVCFVLCLFLSISPLYADVECSWLVPSDSKDDSDGSCTAIASTTGGTGSASASCNSSGIALWKDVGVLASSEASAECHWTSHPPLYCPCPDGATNHKHGSGSASAQCDATTLVPASITQASGNASVNGNGGSASKGRDCSCSGLGCRDIKSWQIQSFNTNTNNGSGCSVNVGGSGDVNAEAHMLFGNHCSGNSSTYLQIACWVIY